MLMRVPMPYCRRVRGFEGLAFWHFWSFKILSVVSLVLVSGLAFGITGDRLHGISELRLALLSCSEMLLIGLHSTRVHVDFLWSPFYESSCRLSLAQSYGLHSIFSWWSGI